MFLKSSLVTLLFGIFVAKIYDAALAEGLFGRSIFSLLIVWAVGIQCLMGYSLFWQSAWTFFYGPIRFVCKILLAALITTNHNSHRWIQLNLVVDILFTRVQVATFPFIDSYIMLMLLFSMEASIVWHSGGMLSGCQKRMTAKMKSTAESVGP